MRSIPDSQEAPKPYEQQPGEPDLWYERLRCFCSLGSSRSVLKCYQVVMQVRDTQASLAGSGEAGQPLPKRDHAPQAWRKKAREFDWLERAATWDAEQYELVAQHSGEILKLVDMADRKVLAFQLNLVEGWMEGPNGETIVVTDIYQRRMAAKDIQRWSRAVRAQFQGKPAEKRTYVQVKEIRVNDLAEENKGNGVANPHE